MQFSKCNSYSTGTAKSEMRVCMALPRAQGTSLLINVCACPGRKWVWFLSPLKEVTFNWKVSLCPVDLSAGRSKEVSALRGVIILAVP